MAMNEHLHIHKKTGYQSASQPQQSQFQSRPFVQAQTEEQSEQPDIKTALQRAKRYGHSLDRIKFSEARVQRPEPRIVQAKLTIGEPGDRYEQEADSVAASVVQQINAPAPQQSTQSQSVQREATPDEEDELMKKPDINAIQRKEEPEEEIQAKPEITALQRQEEPEEEIQAKPNVSDLGRSPLPTQVQREAKPEDEKLQTKSILQRREAAGGGEASTDLESAINSARGGGMPLEAGLQQSMGQAMGADFSGVKVHTDAQADQLNQSIQARAFTTGQDVFFRQGEYNPGSRGGQELLAHELTHVVQQSGGESRKPDKGGEENNHESDEKRTLYAAEVSLQKKTATEFSPRTGVSEGSTLESMTHERVDMSPSAKNYAAAAWEAAGFGAIPARTVCNHHIPYKEVRDKVRGALLGKSAKEVAWRLQKFTVSPQPSDEGYDRHQIEECIDHLIVKYANDPRNLFYWPDTTGDDGGTKRDLPAYSDNTIQDIHQGGVYGELTNNLRQYGQEFDQMLQELNQDIQAQ